jgi:hypothetical protein
MNRPIAGSLLGREGVGRQHQPDRGGEHRDESICRFIGQTPSSSADLRRSDHGVGTGVGNPALRSPTRPSGVGRCRPCVARQRRTTAANGVRHAAARSPGSVVGRGSRGGGCQTPALRTTSRTGMTGITRAAMASMVMSKSVCRISAGFPGAPVTISWKTRLSQPPLLATMSSIPPGPVSLVFPLGPFDSWSTGTPSTVFEHQRGYDRQDHAQAERRGGRAPSTLGYGESDHRCRQAVFGVHAQGTVVSIANSPSRSRIGPLSFDASTVR